MTSSVNAELKLLIKTYTETQLLYDKLNIQLTQIRDKKKQIETQLITNIQNAGLTNYGITFHGQKITLVTDNTYDSLTYKYLEECFIKLYRGDTAKVTQIIDFIKQNRVKTTNKTIKLS